MTPERRQLVDHLLQAALEKPVAERGTFLQQACADDEDLLLELRTRIAAQTDGADLQEVPTAALTSEMLEANTGELLRGRMLGRYELQSALGHGGMGTVFQAQDTQLGRPIALKILPRRFTSNPERVRRFRQEARAISALNHPNILTIHEIGEAPLAEGEVHFLATELVEGRTLRARLNDGGLTLGEALDIATQTAGALAAAHQAGIIHRDIKPENIMVRPDGLVKVLDFGLAKLTGKQAKTSTAAASYSTVQTNPGMVMGTISYMSPEQARGLEVDARSDIFSLGVVLYEMLTGRPPFAGATTGDVLVSILDREPPPLVRLWPQAPVTLQRIVTRALVKESAGRYQQASELQAELKELQQELELAARLRREGKTPTGDAVSLNMRVGQDAELAEGKARQQALLTTQVGAHPTNKSRRLLTQLLKPGKSVVVAVALLAVVLIVAVLSRRWFMPPAETLHTIAVLPFVNQSADPQLDYLSDGLTESLMQSLQQLPGLRVMARGTVFTYKGREVDPRQVGQALTGVRSVVTGRIQRLGDQLIINVELADTRDGTRLWSARHQRSLTELIALQTELARALSAQLSAQNTTAQPTGKGRYNYTANTEAYQKYLQGRHHYNQATYEEGMTALDYYQQAIALDPGYALAYAGIADIYADFSSRYMLPSEAIPLARQAALKALSLDSELAEAHHALAVVKCWGDWDWSGAEQEFKQALTLNPNLATTRAIYANVLAFQRRFVEANHQLEQARQLDPLSSLVHEMLVWERYFERRYDEALAESDKLLNLDPTYFRVYGHICFIYEQKGQLSAAIAAGQTGLAIRRSAGLLTTLAYLYARAGQPVESRKLMKELEAMSRQNWVSPVLFAKIHLGLGEPDLAFRRLQEAYDAHSEFLAPLTVDPVFDPIRTDPRFITLMRNVGLQP
jgi:eukaryotic-like serine/threonine-protein kinase